MSPVLPGLTLGFLAVATILSLRLHRTSGQRFWRLIAIGLAILAVPAAAMLLGRMAPGSPEIHVAVLFAASIFVYAVIVASRDMPRAVRPSNEDLPVAGPYEPSDAEKELENAYAQISASIDYASNIQRAILPEPELMTEALGEHFVVWEPKDVVGGDYYWIREWGDGRLLGVGDCTGHGVPGAFMTLIATATLNWSLRITPPGKLGALMSCINGRIQGVLKKGSPTAMADDGMDLGLFYIPNIGRSVEFCGAGFSMFTAKGGEIAEIKGTRTGIGFQSVPADSTYPTTVLERAEFDRYYLASDGVFDQTGGPRGHGFGKRRFKETLAECYGMPFDEQRSYLISALREYQGGQPRRDDVTIIGFALPEEETTT